MLIPISIQIGFLIYSVLAGVLTGIFFDIYRIVRGLKNTNKYITFVEDLLFWILASILVFLFLLYTNNAYVSIYIYLLIAIGICLYMRFISNSFLAVQYNIISLVSKIVRVTIKTMIFPIEVIIYRINRKKKKK